MFNPRKVLSKYLYHSIYEVLKIYLFQLENVSILVKNDDKLMFIKLLKPLKLFLMVNHSKGDIMITAVYYEV